MYKILLLLLLVVTPSLLVAGQDKDSTFEVFGGYSYTTIDDRRSGTPVDHVGSLDGFNIAVTGYITKRFGITGDFSAGFHRGTAAVTGGSIRFKSDSFNYLVGPHFRFTNKTRVTPFVHALAGGATNRFSYLFTPAGGTSSTVNASQSITDYALALGGGLDVSVSKHFSIRAFQIDYNPVFVRDRAQFGPNSGGRFDNVRFSIGVVIKK